MRQFLTHGKVRTRLSVLAAFLLVALPGPWLVGSVLGTDPHRIYQDAPGEAPGAAHPLVNTGPAAVRIRLPPQRAGRGSMASMAQ